MVSIVFCLLLALMPFMNAQTVHAWSPADPPVSYGTFGTSVDNYGQIAVHPNGNIFVTGGGALGGDVEQLDANGNHIRYFGPSGSTGVAIDLDGNILVVDWDSQVGSAPGVYKFDVNGNSINISSTDLGGTAYIQFAYSIAVDSQGNVYVSDWQGNGDADPVYKFDRNGYYVATITGSGSSFDQITSITVDSSNNLYVLDGNNNRLQIFNSSGTFVRQITGNGGAWNFPEGFTVDDSGNIYVSDSGNERIQIFNSSGVFQQELDATDFGVGSFDYISGLAITDEGKLFVADSSRVLTAQFDRVVEEPSVTSFPGNRTDDSTPSITGTATDSYSTVTNVEFSVDSGAFAACSADDGSFNESSEAYTCTVATALEPGSHTAQIRITDGNTNIGSGNTIASYTFCFGGSNCESPATASAPTGYFVPECTDAKPSNVPNLFRLDVSGTSATLYFAPLPTSSEYVIDYAIPQSTAQYSHTVGAIQSTGINAITINDLAERTPYEFRVMAKNGCRPGEWSNPLTVQTRLGTDTSTRIVLPD